MEFLQFLDKLDIPNRFSICILKIYMVNFNTESRKGMINETHIQVIKHLLRNL